LEEFTYFAWPAKRITRFQVVDKFVPESLTDPSALPGARPVNALRGMVDKPVNGVFGGSFLVERGQQARGDVVDLEYDLHRKVICNGFLNSV
jgi:hypothetical protein